MKHYSVKVHLRPELRYASLLGGATLPQALVGVLEDVVIEQWQSAPSGGDHLCLALSRPSDEELLAEIGAAAVQVGYALVEAEVEEFVDHAVSGALVGFGGAGTATGATSRNPMLTLIAAAIGAWAGQQVGASMRTLVASHRYQLHHNGGWIELPLPERQAPQPDPAAAFLPA
jgi:hypothetical protein